MYKQMLMTLAVAAGLGACASGTKVTAGGEVAPVTPATSSFLPAGTTMSARLNQSVSTSSPDMQAFSATVTDNVYAQDGSIAVPAGAVLEGHVTGAHTAKLPGEKNVIRLNFDALQMNGQNYPFEGSISNVRAEGGRGVGNKAAKGAAIGAAGGGALGAILSGGEVGGLVAGGVLGAAAGTVIAMNTGKAGTEAVIPAGSIVTVRSNQGIQVR